MSDFRIYHIITNSLYDNVMSARIAARDLAAMLWMLHVMSSYVCFMLCSCYMCIMLWVPLYFFYSLYLKTVMECQADALSR